MLVRNRIGVGWLIDNEDANKAAVVIAKFINESRFQIIQVI